jgi:lysozyme
MKFSKKGIELISELEGRKKYKYPDVRGLSTIAMGHLISKSEASSGKIWIEGKAVKYADGLTNEQMDTLLLQDVKVAEDCVNTYVKVYLNQNQFDSLVSFCFNIGNTAFRNSTLLKLLNQEKYEEVPPQMRRWIYADGKVCPGLTNRRGKEIALWKI